MPEVDLTFARQTVAETILLDRCTVTRELPGPLGAVFNEVTGHYENVKADSVVLAVDEPCKVREEADNLTTLPDRQRELYYSVAFAYGRLDAIQGGDVIRVTESRDPRLVDLELDVCEVVESTIRVMRRVRAVRRAHADPASD